MIKKESLMTANLKAENRQHIERKTIHKYAKIKTNCKQNIVKAYGQPFKLKVTAF